jgi:hypothetical protein
MGHFLPARTESLAGTADVGTTDTVKANIYALAREAVNFFHKVLALVINWDTAISKTADAPRDEQVPYISSRARCPSCNSAEPTPPAAL